MHVVIWPLPSGGEGKYVLVLVIILSLKWNCEKQQVTLQENKQH